MSYDGKYDADTARLLDIAVDFLERHFSYDRTDAEQAMSGFLQRFGDVFDEDFFHHQSSFRVAAIVHYMVRLGGSRTGIGSWLRDSGYQDTPADALEYFRAKYFT